MVFFDDFLAVLGLDMGIYDVHRGDVHKRADLAEAVAAGFLEMDGVVGVLERLTETGRPFSLHSRCSVSYTAMAPLAMQPVPAQTMTDKPSRARAFFRLPALGVKRKLCASDHFDSSFRMRSTSATAFSGVIFG